METPAVTPHPDVPRLALTEPEAARALGYTPRGLQNMRLRGRGPEYILIGRHVRYTPEALRDWLHSHPRQSPMS